MSPGVRFPDLGPCVLCACFDGEPARGRIYTPGIGKVCGDCLNFVLEARTLIFTTPDIARHMIADGDRNNRRNAQP